MNETHIIYKLTIAAVIRDEIPSNIFKMPDFSKITALSKNEKKRIPKAANIIKTRISIVAF